MGEEEERGRQEEDELKNDLTADQAPVQAECPPNPTMYYPQISRTIYLIFLRSKYTQIQNVETNHTEVWRSASNQEQY